MNITIEVNKFGKFYTNSKKKWFNILEANISISQKLSMDL